MMRRWRTWTRSAKTGENLECWSIMAVRNYVSILASLWMKESKCFGPRTGLFGCWFISQTSVASSRWIRRGRNEFTNLFGIKYISKFLIVSINNAAK
jgi:hypothetical protein